jgi:hypothetical protein
MTTAVRRVLDLFAALVLVVSCGPSAVGTNPDAAEEADSAPVVIDAAAVDVAEPIDAEVADAPIPDAAGPDVYIKPADAAPPDATPCVPDPDGEICDGVDNNCNGTTDEGFTGVGAECDVGVGACARTGETVCSSDGLEVVCNVLAGPPADELCGNYVDDDCDTATDEGFLDLGVACVNGVGTCAVTGERVCASDGLGTVCDAVPAIAGNELCSNSLDDDCDGLTDEGFHIGAACDGDDGDLCPEGVLVCSSDGKSEVCNDASDTNLESCNSADDDCDGTTDEGFAGLGTTCSGGVGTCARTGTIVCTSDGKGTTCNATPGAAGTELCGNTLDDDCDTATDEGFPDLGVVCSVGTGACVASGHRICSTDRLGTVCDVTAGTGSTELCGDGIDNDCDSTTDEGFDVSAACTVGNGACVRSGNKICSTDKLSTVCNVAAGAPGAELCGNSVDDDCDSSTDEGFPNLGTTCSVGVGTCARSGNMICSPDRLSTLCNVSAGSPGAELCGNSLDDDCDSATDESFDVGAACDGTDSDLCVEGVKVCSTDRLSTVCNDTTSSTVERCNTTDDDCDGLNNEGFDVGTACTVGIGACLSSGTKACLADGSGTYCNATSGTGGVELCGNGGDDDCDGLTDEGFDVGATCSVGTGACVRGGNKICSTDRLTTVCNVAAGAPSTELCGNGVDDDCDTATDEDYTTGTSCTNGIGACLRSGTTVCSTDRLSTVCNAVAGSATTELCGTGVDEDCDSSTDEGFDVGTTCVNGIGACVRSGSKVCTGDRLGTICNATPGTATTELCGSGIDEDCDSSTDEGFDVGAACTNGIGACVRSGSRVCASGGLSTICNATPGSPSSELCGTGVDEDCDSYTDEGFVLGATCTNGIGACQRTGNTICSGDGLSTTCNAVPGAASAELCGTGIDEDCDTGTDEDFSTGSCTVGVGACAATGTWTCATDRLSAYCSATAGSPDLEYCGDGIDSDCSGGADPTCPSNDYPAGAISISSGLYDYNTTVDLTYAHDDDDNTGPSGTCGWTGGRDAFYTFTLSSAMVVYADTFGSPMDTVLRIHSGACTAAGTEMACNDDSYCSDDSLRSRIAASLGAGTYCLVVDQYSVYSSGGTANLHVEFSWATGTEIFPGSSSSATTGTTVGAIDHSNPSCQPNDSVDTLYYFMNCPGSHTLTADTCTAASYDTILHAHVVDPAYTESACNDDSCGLHSSMSATLADSALYWIVVDGYYGYTGTYTLTYSLP